jgi:hypothetical protein
MLYDLAGWGPAKTNPDIREAAREWFFSPETADDVAVVADFAGLELATVLSFARSIEAGERDKLLLLEAASLLMSNEGDVT